MASTTKIMTAVVTLDLAGSQLDRLVPIKDAYRQYILSTGASSAGLHPGDKLTVRQLLYAMLLPSGCDAAYALADTLGTGSTTAARVKNFVARMNAKSTMLGLTGTKFASFDGNASASSNYTTPRSLARLAAHALRNGTFAAIVATASTHQLARSGTGTRSYSWTNSDELLGGYPGLIGVKTGTSTAAGACFVFAARRNGKYVVGVVLRSSSKEQRYVDARRIMDWAFAS